MQMQGQLIEINFPVKATAWGLSCFQKSILQGAPEQQCASSGTPLKWGRHEHSLVEAPALFTAIPSLPWPGENLAEQQEKKKPSSSPSKTKPELKCNRMVCSLGLPSVFET